MRRITFKHLEFSLWREIFPSKVNEVCLLEYTSLVKKSFPCIASKRERRIIKCSSRVLSSDVRN